jgi:hypothetical protein
MLHSLYLNLILNLTIIVAKIMLAEMSFLETLPIDNLLQITQYLDIEDVIYLRRADKKTANYFDNKTILNPLSFEKIGVWVNSFNEMIELYNCKYITFHSLKYFSLNECFRKCGCEKNMKYAYFFLEKGAINYDDFLISACENGNIFAFELCSTFSSKFSEHQIKKAVISAARCGYLEILKYFDEEHIFNFFPDIADVVIQYNHFVIIKWLFEEYLFKSRFLNKKFIDGLIEAAIKYNNFVTVDLIFSCDIHNQIEPHQLFLYCIKHSTLNMFKYLVSHKYLEIFSTSVNHVAIFLIVKYGRIGIVKFLHTSQVITFDQFQWDCILLCCCSTYPKYTNMDPRSLIKYCLANGSKLYKTVLIFSLSRKWHDLIEYILRQKDIFENFQSTDYMVKLYFFDRNYKPRPHLTGHTEIIEKAEKIVFPSTGYINHDDFFFYAWRSGNKLLIDKVKKERTRRNAAFKSLFIP